MLEAREHLRAASIGALPYLDAEDQESILNDIQERAGYARKEGYRDDVASISLEDFRREIKRGIYGG